MSIRDAIIELDRIHVDSRTDSKSNKYTIGIVRLLLSQTQALVCYSNDGDLKYQIWQQRRG